MQTSTIRLRGALTRVLHRYPYFAQWLSPRLWNASTAVGTMAVTVKSGRPRFLFNPFFVAGCSDAEIEGVIHHELNHLVFGHPSVDPDAFENKHALVIAEELTVNEHVSEPLPGNPLTLKGFPELPPGEDTMTRYDRLKDRDDLAEHVRTLDSHALWCRGDSCCESTFDSVRHQRMSQLLRSCDRESLDWAMHGIGLHPGIDLTLEIQDGSEGRPIDWQHLLTSTSGCRPRRVTSFQRPPRRMPQQIGVIPGTVCRPDKPPVMAVIDTSSSMEISHFNRIRSELNHLREHAEITVVQCDKEIRKTFALTGLLTSIVGRGGTDLRPPLSADFLSQHRPSVVFYFTDGDGPVPDQAPTVPVVWCLTAPNRRPASWGKVVQL